MNQDRRFRVLLLGLLAAASGYPLQGQDLTPAQQKAADMRLPDLDRSALEPDKRGYSEVRPGERNPFGLLSVPPPETKEVEVMAAETEEARIRRILGNMRISGVSGSPGSYRVLLGPLQIKEGDTLPKLFSDQAEVLRVKSITDKEVILALREKDPSLPPRTIGLSYDLKPRPVSLLAGDFFRKLVPFTPKGAPDLKPLESSAVKAMLKGAEDGEMQSLTERSFEMLGELDHRATDKTDEKSDK